jgi:LuxR family transcriptional regulator, maltose regulon positive regulatory protein
MDSLVSIKLRVPQARPNLVARPRLAKRLEREAGRKLTLLSAPAGFGKTTLLLEWLEGRAGGGSSVAWLSLDEADNDPARFLSHLVAALKTIEEGTGEGVLAALHSPEPPRIDALAGALVDEFAAIRGEAALVLDDYHVIDACPVHEIVTFMLDHLQPNVHLAISSRVDPPLPLARLRARDQMAELRASDLRFAPEEAAAFFKDVMGLELSEEDVATLESTTEGWIAGLQLAALSMQGREDVSGFVKSFSGRHRHVFDFLAGEVLERQPERVREFLLMTAVLNRLSGSLCDALTGRSDGQELLERLERENLFVFALDDERRWYRYHHLFRDFLRSRLERESPERIPELHLRASEWYERGGWLFEAVGHALSAGDYERAADLVGRVAREAWSRGEALTLLGWLNKLPSEVMRRRPKLLLEQATALVVSGRLDDAEASLREAERAAGVDGEGSGEVPEPGVEEVWRRHLLGGAAAVRSWRARLRGDTPDAIKLARRALELLPENAPGLRSFAAICLGEAHRSADDLAAAGAAFAEAAELGRAAGHNLGMLLGMVQEARVRRERGLLREAHDILRRALQLAAERGIELMPAAGFIRVGMGVLHYEWDDLDSASRRLADGMELAGRMGELAVLVRGHVVLSRVKRARGDVEGSLEEAREAERLAQRSGIPQAIVEAATWKARLHLARGELAVATFEHERAANVGEVPPAARQAEQTVLARLLITRGEHDEALGLLGRLRETAGAAGRTGSVIEILALQALALQSKGENERAVGTVAKALALAEPEGYVRTFVDEGSPMEALLSEVIQARQRGRLAPDVPAYYLRKLSAALEREGVSGAAAGHPRPAERLVEPLSERELEVLALLAAGKTNQQIAKELFISLGTVKSHINNIYRKLDVRSRTQALAKVRELNLI